MDTSTWRLRVTSDSSSSRVFARRHQFTVGQPVDFDQEAQVTALEYALGALGAEVVGGLRAFARRRRITLDHVEAVLDGELDHPLSYLEVIGESEPTRLARVSIRVYVASPDNRDRLERLWNDTLERLPLVRTFGRALTLNIELAEAA